MAPPVGRRAAWTDSAGAVRGPAETRAGRHMGMNAKLIQQMQARMVKMQEDLANQRVEASAGGGAVTVVATGQQKIESIKISPEAIDPDDPTMLEDLVLAAINEALDKSKDLMAQQLSALTGGI